MMRRNAVVVVAVLGVVFTACGGGEEDPPPSATELGALVDDYDWPAEPPSGAALVAFLAADGGRPPVRWVVERANMCAWYSRWLALSRGEATGDIAAVERYITDVVTQFEMIREAAAGAQSVRENVAQARAGNDIPMVALVEANDCDVLGI